MNITIELYGDSAEVAAIAEDELPPGSFDVLLHVTENLGDLGLAHLALRVLKPVSLPQLRALMLRLLDSEKGGSINIEIETTTKTTTRKISLSDSRDTEKAMEALEQMVRSTQEKKGTKNADG